MSEHEEFYAANRLNWDERASIHAASPSYEIDRLLSGPDEISQVVAFDRPRLGDIAGLDAVHLQCHIGTDTLSLHKLGARMSGLDLSPASIEQARSLASRAGAAIEYVVGNAYDAPTLLGRGRFDLVYTGIGALCWLPDIDRWSATVAALLRPGGRLFVRDGHPMLNALADTTGPDDLLRVAYSYYQQAAPNRWDLPQTYVETDATLTHSVAYDWNHGLGEIVTACLNHGLAITGLEEHDSVPWLALEGLMTCDEFGEYRLSDRPERLAASFTLQARKLP